MESIAEETTIEVDMPSEVDHHRGTGDLRKKKKCFHLNNGLT